MVTNVSLLLVYVARHDSLGRLPLDEKYYNPMIDSDTKMECLIPTTSEAGVCTTALVDFLTLTHNSFIERCRGLVAENDPRYNII